MLCLAHLFATLAAAYIAFPEQFVLVGVEVIYVVVGVGEVNSEKDYLINRASLKRIFNETAQKNRDALLSCGVSLNVDIDDIPVYTDSKWLEYILGQLMGNSMKYFSKDREPEIRLWTEETENSVILHYRDNGI